MSTKPETKLQNAIRKKLVDRGCWVVKFHGSPFTKKGTPDLLICYRGLFLAMEVKVQGEEQNTTELQEYQIKKIKEAKGLALVISSVEQAERVLDLIDKKFRRDI